MSTNKTTKSKASKKQTKSSSKRNFWIKHWKEGLVLFLLASALYAVSISFDYTLDDVMMIQDNQYTNKGFAGIKDILTTESFQGYFGQQMDLLVGARYRPLSIVTFAIENEFVGKNPAVGHFFNILLYALTGLLLFRTISLMTPRLKNANWYFTLPFLASLLFIAHPVHSEAVANIKGRDEIMSFMFAIGCLYCALKYVKKGGLLSLIFIPILFFLGFVV